MNELNIFNYDDYRKFLSDFYLDKKSKNSLYSHRVFAREAGLNSPSHLLMIIKGQRNLSLKTIHKFNDGLKLKQKEKQYFELMVLYNQSTDLDLKSKYFSKILKLKAAQVHLNNIEKEKFDFLSQWHVVMIYVMIELVDFEPDVNWIVKKSGRKVTHSQVKNALNCLLQLDLIEVDETKGYRQKVGALSIDDDTKSLAVFQYHRSMIDLAAESLKSCRLESREMNGVTIPMSLEHLNLIKEKIRKFRKEINQLASTLEDPDQVFQLNIQLFPLTDMEEK